MLPLYYKVLLKCLFYLLHLFGLYLPVEFLDLTLYESKFWTFKQIYALFLSTLLVLSYSYLEWLGAKSFYRSARTSNVILIVLDHTVATTICLLSILGTAFWNREKWKRSLNLQKILLSKMEVKLRRNGLYFCLEFILGHCALFIIIGIDQWWRYAFGGGDLLQVLIILLKHALLYYVFLIVIVIYNGVLLLRNYFQSLKIYLTNTIGLEGVDSPFSLYKPLDGHITLPIAVISDKTLFRLREASTISNILFERMDIFNEVFGMVILLINMSGVVSILSAFNTLLVSAETTRLTTEVIVDCLFEAFICLVWNCFILSASGLLKEETREIVKLCCKLQHLMPPLSQERKELLNIAHQVKRKSPTISAAGFFDVDFYLILAVFTFVGTYVVVLIQFTHMDF